MDRVVNHPHYSGKIWL